MTNEDTIVAPSLSTYQDQETFEFQQYGHQFNDRSHLSSKPLENDQHYRDLIASHYSIDSTAEYIKAHPEWKRVTLQFPDNLVCDSSIISQLLSDKLGVNPKIHSIKESSGSCGCDNNCQTDTSCSNSSNSDEGQSLWILADTSYSPCCVDEVAAEHVKGDVVIHYGDACLNRVSKLPVAYVFGKPVVDTSSIIEKFKAVFEQRNSKVILMSDTPYAYVMEHIYNQLRGEYQNVVFSDVSQDSFPEAMIIGYTAKVTPTEFQLLNRSFHGLPHNPDTEVEELLMDYELFHIGVPEAPRLLKLSTMFSSVTLYDPAKDTISQGPFPNLMRRYRYMQVARSSGTIGLLVNTLSLANTKLLLNRLKQKITDAGKKSYMFVVGKPNVAKLANFESIDVWCILGCDHQGIIIDQKNEYFKPVITPFELLLSLNSEVVWTGKWETDFKKLLQQMGEENEEDQEGSDIDEPQFDPVSGKFVSTARPLRRPQYLEISSGPQEEEANSDALIKKFSSEVAIKDTVSTAAIQLQNRHWTGLGSDYTDESSERGALAEEGTSGIARGYDYDVSNK